MVVSLFGESTDDQRDFRMGLAGLTAGVHALRILAEQKVTSWGDISLSINGVRDVLDTISEQAWRPGEREALDRLLLNVINIADPNNHG